MALRVLTLGFLIEADSVQELANLRSRIVNDVDILSEEGKSMMYKKCFYE